MSVQLCEGVWRQKCGRYVAVTSCEQREYGQRWTDGIIYYFLDGTVTFAEGGSVVDLVEYIGPFPQPGQAAEIERLQGELQQAEMQRIAEANALRIEQADEIERLQAELRGYAAESHRQLRTLQASHDNAMATLRAEQRGEREGFRIAISIILEASR